jgi:hypothetical protein
LVRRWRRRRRRGDASWFDVPDVGGDSIVGAVVLAVVVVVAVVAALWLTPLLFALLLGIIEFAVLLLLTALGGLWAWVRRRPRLLVATAPDGTCWFRPGDGGTAGADADALEAGIAPAALGYRPLDR